MSTTWIVVGGHSEVGNLVSTAASIGGGCTAVVVGDRACADAVAAAGVDRVIWAGTGAVGMSEAYATWVADTVAAEAPKVVLGTNRASDRVLLGAVAGRLGASVFVMSSAVAGGEETTVTHAQFGGIAERTVTASGPVVVVMEPAAAEPQESVAPVEPVEADQPLGLKLEATREAEHDSVDLSKARRIIAVGRGCKDQSQLEEIQKLATLLDAEVACSRPLAEGLNWFTHDRYVGVTGQTVAPELYIALGISGQLQHVVGARDAGTIVVVNTDADAPYFAESDYNIVADMAKVVPALVEALG